MFDFSFCPLFRKFQSKSVKDVLGPNCQLCRRSGPITIARRNPHEKPFTRDEMLEASSDADALLVNPFDQLDSDFFKRVNASLKVIATTPVGTDHIDLEAAKR